MPYIDGNRLFMAKAAIPLWPRIRQRVAEHEESVWPLLFYRSERALEIIRIAYFPRQHRQLQRTRRDREYLFELKHISRVIGLVKDGDTGKFRHRVFEQLQTLAAEIPGQVGKAGNVAAGTGKAFNKPCLDRIKPLTHHNDGNRLSRILGRADHRGPSCHDDDIDLESNQLGQKIRKPIALTFRIAVLGSDVLSFDVAKLAQNHTDRVGTSGVAGCRNICYIPYPPDFLRLLRLNHSPT